MRPPYPPFTPCWCETRPDHPRCQDTPALSIESVGLSLTIKKRGQSLLKL